MKKLLITLTAAIVTSMTMAATTPTAQVYDVCLKVKSTAAATAKVNNKQNPIAVEPGEDSVSIVYRKQSSATWKGIIWGCGCETINGKWETVENDCEGLELKKTQTVKGCILWDDKTKVPVYIGYDSDLTDESSVPGTGFGWNLLHCINKDGKQVEGVWTMKQNGNVCDESGVLFEFVGSGFGTASVILDEGYPTCLSYIKSISGNFAGWMKAPSKTSVTEWSGCTYCGLTGGDVSCDFAEGWQWCDWYNVCGCNTGIDENLEYTSAYGTWTIKYNSTMSKKLAQPLKVSDKGVSGVVVSIRDVYDFKKLPRVEAAIEAVENKIWGVKSECDLLEDAVAEARADVKAAEQKVNDVSTTNLYAKLGAAKGAWAAANAELNAAVLERTASNMVMIAASDDYSMNAEFATNSNWTISYKNASQDVATETGIGIETFEAAVEELKGFTFLSIYFGGEFVGSTYAAATQFIDETNEALETSEQKLEDAKAGYAYAVQNANDKQVVADDLASKYSKANLEYENRYTSQTLAAQQLGIAKIALTKAEANYEKAGCN